MKAIRIFALAGAAGLIAAGLALAAVKAAPGARQGCRRVGAHLAQVLNLTDQQKAQIKPIRERYRAQFQELRQSSLDRQAKMTRFRELRDKMRAEIAPILTPEQRDKVAKWQQSHPHMGMQGRRMMMMMRRVARELQLTPDQRTKIHGIIAGHRDEIQALRRDAHAQNADRTQIQERAVALKEKIVAEVKPVLTPAQQTKLDAMIQRWQQHHVQQPKG